MAWEETDNILTHFGFSLEIVFLGSSTSCGPLQQLEVKAKKSSCLRECLVDSQLGDEQPKNTKLPSNLQCSFVIN